MIRIQRFTSYRDHSPSDWKRVHELCKKIGETVEKVDGVGWVKVCTGGGNIVFLTELKSHAVIDAIHADENVQKSIAHFASEESYRSCGEEYLHDFEQIRPLVRL